VISDIPELGALGRVDPPAPGVLDAAREVLWSAVAAEMLATASPDAARAPGGQATDRSADTPVRRPRSEDLGA
jgi:hypothetical protein